MIIISLHISLLSIEKRERLHSDLKITEKVSFNIASEASYVYILNGQKFIINALVPKFLSSWVPEFLSSLVPKFLSFIVP